MLRHHALYACDAQICHEKDHARQMGDLQVTMATARAMRIAVDVTGRMDFHLEISDITGEQMIIMLRENAADILHIAQLAAAHDITRAYRQWAVIVVVT